MSARTKQVIFSVLICLIGFTATLYAMQDTKPTEKKAEYELKCQETFAKLRKMFPNSILDKDFKTLKQVTSSKAYLDFLKDAYYGFLELQGVPWDKDEYYRFFEENFQKHFPGKTPEALESQMRQTLINLFVESGNDFIQIFMDFLNNEENVAWMIGYFPGDDRDFGNWTVDVIKDYLESPITDTSELVETEEPVSTTQGTPDEGLRRLKKSDPEVATQIERLIQANRRTIK